MIAKKAAAAGWFQLLASPLSQFFGHLFAWLLPETEIENALAGISAADFMSKVGWTHTKEKCVSDANSDTTVFSLFNYKHELVRQAIWLLKYQGSLQAARIFGECLYEVITKMLVTKISCEKNSGKNPESFKSIIIIPMPISRERQKERGWNQSELIADVLSEKITKRGRGSKNEKSTKELDLAGKLTVLEPGIFIKTRHTLPQTRLSRRERLKNLKDCFAVTDPTQIKDQTIILIDDVVTTGATISEASATLRRAGARSVIAVTVAC